MKKATVKQDIKTMYMFDTHSYIKELKAAGFDEKQAECIIKSLLMSREADLSHLTTKEQVKDLEHSLNAKIDASVASLNAKIDASVARFEIKLETKISDMQTRILIWMIGTMITLCASILTGIKFLWS